MIASARPDTLRFEDRRRREPPRLRAVTGNTGSLPAAPALRVLVAFEELYRSYGEAIAGAVRLLRPDAQVLIARPDTLGTEVTQLEPHLVISDRPAPPNAGSALAWVELPHDPTLPTTVRLESRSPKPVSPALDGLLSVLDEVERLVRNRSRRTEP